VYSKKHYSLFRKVTFQPQKLYGTLNYKEKGGKKAEGKVCDSTGRKALVRLGRFW
jgi:hypothetical protein